MVKKINDLTNLQKKNEALRMHVFRGKTQKKSFTKAKPFTSDSNGYAMISEFVNVTDIQKKSTVYPAIVHISTGRSLSIVYQLSNCG